MATIQNIDELEAIYGFPAETSTAKVTRQLTPDYRKLVQASPFLTLATSGPEGLDCSPRGDFPGFVRIVDDTTLLLPDRRGNNRIDSLRNIVRDPRVALLFFLPGCGSTLRINGNGTITTDAELLASFAVDGQAPRSVIKVQICEVYFQCARAIVRSDLWNSKKHVDASKFPTPGQILANLTDERVGGEAYDEEWPERARKTLW